MKNNEKSVRSHPLLRKNVSQLLAPTTTTTDNAPTTTTTL